MGPYVKKILLLVTAVGLTSPGSAQSVFRVPPYVQNPSFDGMSILWLSEASVAGTAILLENGTPIDTLVSDPVLAGDLEYPSWEVSTNPNDFPNGVAPDPPYLHRVRFHGLQPGISYTYRVVQSGSSFESNFRTTPVVTDRLRFIVYGDSETQPENQRNRAKWADPARIDPDREYLIEKLRGYANNLAVIHDRNPDFVAIAGDLVQSGGEQRDWDEFWRLNTHPDPDSSLASKTVLLPAPGNHEYFSSPHEFQGDLPKRYRQPWSELAMARYRTYFEVPSNGTGDALEDRFYRIDYGPVTLIAVDVSNNGPNENPDDTNFDLLGAEDTEGGPAPSFSPGSPQYQWLESELADAQLERPFTFVLLHYAPYSVGPHGLPPGEGEGLDPLSGVPVRNLTPLFHQYGVDAVFAGHDEMWERSVVAGTEIRPDGTQRAYDLHFYDVGTGGDDLRGPLDGLENPFQAFYVHNDVEEVWEGDQLVDGGKHYGHLEVEVFQPTDTTWQATLTPAYVFPLFDQSGSQYLGFERRIYDDVVILETSDPVLATSIEDETPRTATLTLNRPYPHPVRSEATFEYFLAQGSHIQFAVFDVLGRRVALADQGLQPAGTSELHWKTTDLNGASLPPGLYVAQLRAAGQTVSVPVIVAGN